MEHRAPGEDRGDVVMGVVALTVVAVVVVASLWSFLPGDEPTPAGASAPSEGTTGAGSALPEPTTVPTAVPTPAPTTGPPYGCRSLLDAGEVTRVSTVVAVADRDHQTHALGLGGPIHSIGLGECETFPVVVVHVLPGEGSVPAAGPRGTPVVVEPGLPLVPFDG
ncbi:hypothetical protein [Nocardioides sp. CFH 31398]|uniref:hypothetical protein n=1 Tax=Nocardioides sp. CFH 31398 TaxID=2919579 RepID=UPI001F0632C1|nr:hypothetical protein [Nocardioides sp. CFH 31398]MCH1867001.1 hypothetical protein [Nocardioides sp. CFH 31398]